MARRTRARVVTFGPGGDVRADELVLDDELRPQLHLVTPWGDTTVRLAARGAHMVENALAAATAALVCDVPLDRVAGALAGADVSRWRMELRTLPSGARLLNDAYNANPTSMAAAVDALAALPGRRFAVLGPMAELGRHSAAEHRRLGQLVAAANVELLVAVNAPDLAEGARAAGTKAVDVATAQEAVAALSPHLQSGDAVLIKASRVVGLERVAEALVESPR
jgi:UDP-N-acetylmuramoyl-tripeptide--D-alanyl-D-alanine ligase